MTDRDVTTGAPPDGGAPPTPQPHCACGRFMRRNRDAQGRTIPGWTCDDCGPAHDADEWKIGG